MRQVAAFKYSTSKENNVNTFSQTKKMEYLKVFHYSAHNHSRINPHIPKSAFEFFYISRHSYWDFYAKQEKL